MPNRLALRPLAWWVTLAVIPWMMAVPGMANPNPVTVRFSVGPEVFGRIDTIATEATLAVEPPAARAPEGVAHGKTDPVKGALAAILGLFVAVLTCALAGGRQQKKTRTRHKGVRTKCFIVHN